MARAGCQRLLTFVSLTAGLSVAGCAGSPRDLAPAGSNEVVVDGQRGLEVVGDWNDAAASVLVAASGCEMAVAAAPGLPESAAATRLAFGLITATDEPVSLWISRASTGESREIPMRVAASVGRFGDPVRERRLVNAVARRLEQLRGVEIAPAR